MSRTLHPVLAAPPAVGVSTAVPLAATAALLLAQLALPAAVSGAAGWLAVVGVLLGVPHGAVDHLVPFWLRRSQIEARAMLGVLAGYLAVAGLAAIALLAVPVPAVLGFLVVSALHFGRGETTFAAERAGRPTPRVGEQLLGTFAHGAAVVALPYAVWHTEAAALLGRLAPGLATAPALVPPLLAAGTGLLVVSAVLDHLRHDRRLEAVELGAVAVLFLAVPPAAAFGLYFAGWHALRHTARLVRLVAEVDPAGPEGAGQRAWRTYATHAAAPTAVAVTAMGVVWAAADSAGSGSALTAGLAVLLALTFPHLRTVAALDRARSHPSPPGGGRGAPPPGRG